MRLIDADTLIKDLSYLYTKNHIPIDMKAKEVLTTVMQQPTAYDVDKVVATMDKALIELEDGTNCGTCVFKEVCDNGYDGCIQTIVAVCKSIVKAGGRDER